MKSGRQRHGIAIASPLRCTTDVPVFELDPRNGMVVEHATKNEASEYEDGIQIAANASPSTDCSSSTATTKSGHLQG